MSRREPLHEVQRALEAAGAEFIERGVRRRRRTPEEIEARCPGDTGDRQATVLPYQAMLPPFTEDDLYDENGL